jgi:hypothetical protein
VRIFEKFTRSEQNKREHFATKALPLIVGTLEEENKCVFFNLLVNILRLTHAQRHERIQDLEEDMIIGKVCSNACIDIFSAGGASKRVRQNEMEEREGGSINGKIDKSVSNSPTLPNGPIALLCLVISSYLWFPKQLRKFRLTQNNHLEEFWVDLWRGARSVKDDGKLYISRGQPRCPPPPLLPTTETHQ